MSGYIAYESYLMMSGQVRQGMRADFKNNYEQNSVLVPVSLKHHPRMLAWLLWLPKAKGDESKKMLMKQLLGRN